MRIVASVLIAFAIALIFLGFGTRDASTVKSDPLGVGPQFSDSELSAELTEAEVRLANVVPLEARILRKHDLLTHISVLDSTTKKAIQGGSWAVDGAIREGIENIQLARTASGTLRIEHDGYVSLGLELSEIVGNLAEKRPVIFLRRLYSRAFQVVSDSGTPEQDVEIWVSSFGALQNDPLLHSYLKSLDVAKWAPAPGAIDARNPKHTFLGRTRGDGFLAIDVPMPDPCTLNVFARLPGRRTSVVVDLCIDKLDPVCITLPPFTKRWGRILTTDGRPIQGARMRLARSSDPRLMVSDKDGKFYTLGARSTRELLEVEFPVNAIRPLRYDAGEDCWHDIFLPEHATITGRITGADSVARDLQVDAWHGGELVAKARVDESGFFEVEAPVGDIALRVGHRAVYPIRTYATRVFRNPGMFCVIDLADKLSSISMRLTGLEGRAAIFYIFEQTQGEVDYKERSNWREHQCRIPSDGGVTIEGISSGTCAVRTIGDDGVTGAWTGLLKVEEGGDLDVGTLKVGHFAVSFDAEVHSKISAWAPNVLFYESGEIEETLMLPPGPWALLPSNEANSFNGSTWLIGGVGEKIAASGLLGATNNILVTIGAEEHNLLGTEIKIYPENLTSRIPSRPLTSTRLRQGKNSHTFQGVAEGRYVVDARLPTDERMRSTVNLGSEAGATVALNFQPNTKRLRLDDSYGGKSMSNLIALNENTGTAFDATNSGGEWSLRGGLDDNVVAIIWAETKYQSTRFGYPVTYARLVESAVEYVISPYPARLDVIELSRDSLLWGPRMVLEGLESWPSGSLTWGMEMEVGGRWISEQTFSFDELPPSASGYIIAETLDGRQLVSEFRISGTASVVKLH